MFASAIDCWDEGIPVVLDRLQNRAGVKGLTVAVSYHAARDLLPHNPIRRVAFLESGVVYFRPELERYAVTPLQPKLASIAAGRDILAELRDPTAERGIELGAWVVFLHNTRLASAHPSMSTRNAFGDSMVNTLCPANPAVRKFCIALASDIAHRRPGALHLESLSFMPYDHGNHHERTFIALDALSRYLLSLCFCESCCQAAHENGVDVEAVQAFTRLRLEVAFASDAELSKSPKLEQHAIASAVAGEFGRFIEVRQRLVTSLVEAVCQAIWQEAPAARITYLDVSGAFASGQPDSVSAVDLAWRDGLDLPAIAALTSSIGVCGYFRSSTRLHAEIAEYRRVLPEGTSMEIIFRPGWPDNDSAASLAEKVRSVMDGNNRISFYHYGMVRLDVLDWIKTALAA